jgi:hypothetical protein
MKATSTLAVLVLLTASTIAGNKLKVTYPIVAAFTKEDMERVSKLSEDVDYDAIDEMVRQRRAILIRPGTIIFVDERDGDFYRIHIKGYPITLWTSDTSIDYLYKNQN